MKQPRFYKLESHIIFTVKGNKVKMPSGCKLIKIRKYIKWYNPFTWFTKYYTYEYLGEKYD